MDDNNSKSLDKAEFTKALQDFRIDVTSAEAVQIFNAFDSDRNGEISYDEFIRGVRGPINEFR
jgi:Ca2+-binding EF-hand superfamily protein